jgi:hypothetical protein
MRISKEEGLRMALALDTAITCLEDSDAPLPATITKSLKQDSLIQLRTLRSAALRANREAAQQDVPYSLIGGEKSA